MNFEINSTVTWIEDGEVFKGTVQGFHRNLGMVKVLDDDGRDSLKDPNELIPAFKGDIKKLTVGSSVKITKDHGLTQLSSCWISEEQGQGEKLYGVVDYIDFSDNTVRVAEIKAVSGKEYKDKREWVDLDNVQILPTVEFKTLTSETLDALTDKILQWGIDRNITREGGATPLKQVSKLTEELAECLDALAEVDRGVSDSAERDLKDSYGDMMVCIIQACRLSGFDVKECLQLAYDEIKDRKGTMIGGKFVKEA